MPVVNRDWYKVAKGQAHQIEILKRENETLKKAIEDLKPKPMTAGVLINRIEEAGAEDLDLRCADEENNEYIVQSAEPNDGYMWLTIKCDHQQ